jgi:hypothetical protein
LSERRREKDKHMRQVVFEKTLAIFADLLQRDLSLDVGNQVQASTNGQTVYIPESIPAAGIKGLCYPLYVTMEHELSHLIFNTNFYDFINYRESKENKDLAAWCYNMAEDERIESCWNLIYRTPFQHMYKRLFIMPNVRRGQQLTTMDVMMDVRGDFIRNKDIKYLTAWKEIRTILNEVRGIVKTSVTIRVADKLYDYFMQNGMLVGGKCDLVEGRRNRDKMNREGHKELNKIRIDPNKLQGGKMQGQSQMSEADYRLLKDLLNRYGNYFKHDNVYPDKNRIPTSSLTGIEGERDVSNQYLDALKKQLLPDYVPEKPENRVIGDIEFIRFNRGDPTPVDKSVKSLIPFKRKATRWYSDVGEFDPDEYVQRIVKNDLDDIDFFEDSINVKGMDIIFLVDYSGSMSGYYWGRGTDYKGKEFYLKQAIYSLWKSVETIPGINVQTIIFSGSWGSTTPMEIIRDPEECLKVRPGGSTHTYRALDYVHRLLEHRKDKRRIVFLLTDGEPTPDAVVKNPYQYVKTVIERMRKSRIDLFTIFIEANAISEEKMRYFGNKTNCLYLPPQEMEKFLRVEVAKLVRNYTKSF